jgi:hypothetical protein
MRHRTALVVALWTGAFIGCAGRQPLRTSTWLDRLLQPAGPAGPEAVQMDVALLERPFGDHYLNEQLWEVADEQVVALESRARLEDNGFRIGQIGGITPAELQGLLTSERSCVNPRRLSTLAGRPSKLVLGPELAVCRFQVARGSAAVPVSLEKAECSLEVVPSLTADGRTRLRFVPQILHGEIHLLPRPAADLSGWILKEERATERYQQLAWEVALAPGEYVLIGGRYDRPKTLGQQCFLRSDEPTPVQRLLVIRTTRSGKEAEPVAPLAFDERFPLLPTLACRAAWTTARGSSR